jgi:hypothetical protein
MELEPITIEQMSRIALEEGLKAGIALDSLRLAMLNEAVDWLCDLTDLPKTDVRRMLAANKSRQVTKNLATINAVRSLLRDERQHK